MTGWGLISEDGETLSLGRTSFWFLFGVSAYFWFMYDNTDFPPTLLTMLEINLAYNFGKKGIEVANNAVTALVTPKTK